MKCKMPSVLLLVAAVFIMVAGDCIKDIQDLERDPKYTTLMGRYERVKDPENDAVVRKIVADSIEQHNKISNDIYLYKDDDHYVAYRQLASGENYCCSFHAISYGCRSGRTGDICKTKQTLICSIKANKAFKDTYATIDEGSLHCTLLPQPNKA